MRVMGLAVLAAVAIAGPAVAQTEAQVRPVPRPVPVCPATPTPLPAELAGWGTGRAVGDQGTLVIGAGSVVEFVAQPKFAVVPAKAPPVAAFGASLHFAIRTAGTYRVALGDGVWVDVIQGRRVIESSAHGHGPACSPVRKMVDFQLGPGRYVLQLSDGKLPRTPVMIARL